MPEACSFYSGHLYIRDCPSYRPHKPTPRRNGPILTTHRTICNVVTSETEAETSGTFNNAKDGVGIQTSLFVLGHKQPPNPCKTENSTTTGFVDSGMKPKRSKIWDMKIHWLHKKYILKQIRLYWCKGDNNNADYFKKNPSEY